MSYAKFIYICLPGLRYFLTMVFPVHLAMEYRIGPAVKHDKIRACALYRMSVVNGCSKHYLNKRAFENAV